MGKWAKYEKHYCKKWETDEMLKDWIRSVSYDNTKAYCVYCKCNIRAHHSDLISHGSTEKHKRNGSSYNFRSCAPDPEEKSLKHFLKVAVPREIHNKEMSEQTKKLASSGSSNNPESSKESLEEDKKIGWCRQKFREDWCAESEFAGWLEEVPDDPFRAWCKCCQCTLLVGRSELLKHSATKKHRRAFQECKLSTPLVSLLDGSNKISNSVSAKIVDEALLRTELRLASFIVDHQLDIKAVEHLGSLITGMSERLDLIPKIDVNVQKYSTIVDQVLMTTLQNDLQDVLKSQGFSIIIEEGVTCDPGHYAFAIIVKYYNETKNKVWSQLLDTFILKEQDLSERSMLDRINDILIHFKASVNNLIAIAMDHSIQLFNASDSHKCRDRINIFNFNSNSIAKVVLSIVQSTLPDGLQSLMHHFGCIITGKFKHIYQSNLLPDFQEFLNFDTRQQFLSIATSEWLINPKCNSIIAQGLQLLINVLEKRCSENPTCSNVTKALLDEARDPYTKAYFLFLSHILSHLTEMHDLLRPSSVINYQLIKKISAQYRVLCQHFLTPAAFMVNDLTKIDVEDSKNLLPENSIFVGTDCQEYLRLICISTPKKTKEFMSNCRRLLQQAAIEIKKRIPLDDLILKLSTFVDPEIAFNNDSRVTIPTLTALGVKLPNLVNCSKLDEQWLALPNYFSTSDIEELKKLPVDTMWGVIGDMRNSEDILVFGALGRLAKTVLSFPTPDEDVITLTNMVSEVTRELRTDEEMKARLELIPLKYSILRNNTGCCQQRVTMKNRKLYMLSVHKKSEFPPPRYIFENND